VSHKSPDARGARTVGQDKSPGLRQDLHTTFDSKQQLFGGPPETKDSSAHFELTHSNHERKTESQILNEKRKEHATNEAIRHKKDFISYVKKILETKGTKKEDKTQTNDLGSILPVHERDERDPTS